MTDIKNVFVLVKEYIVGHPSDPELTYELTSVVSIHATMEKADALRDALIAESDAIAPLYGAWENQRDKAEDQEARNWRAFRMEQYYARAKGLPDPPTPEPILCPPAPRHTVIDIEFDPGESFSVYMHPLKE